VWVQGFFLVDKTIQIEYTCLPTGESLMGYTTDFKGRIKIDPPLNPEEIEYLTQFACSRRMNRKKGPYFVDGTGSYGQGEDFDIIDYNRPPMGQPNLWCQWTPTADGQFLGWDGGEKFYNSPEWMLYLIEHFLKPGCNARGALPFLQNNHICNGRIEAQGEDNDDTWCLVVEDNRVYVED
jgi:hypothetical protein